MTDEQVQIMNFMQTSPETWFARKEIARRAVRRSVYDENNHWADAALAELLVLGVLERSDSGLYRIKQTEQDEEEENPR
jgi:hypothetical protein